MIADHRLSDGFGVAFCVQCRVRYPDLLLAVVSGCLTHADIELMQQYNVPFWRKPMLYTQVVNELEESFPAVRERMLNAPVLSSEPSRPSESSESSEKGSLIRGLLKKFF